MNELKIFDNPEFGEIRTVTIDGEPWFVGKDVAVALGYENPQKAIKDHVFFEDKKMGERNVTPSITDSVGRLQYPTFINESGVYALVFGSKLDSAKRFKHWVTSEVLPSIRKHGGYISGQEELSDDELMAKAILVAQKKIAERDAIIEQQKNQIEKDRPKTLFADAIVASHSSILVGELSKILKQNGIDTGQNRLFDYLRENGYLIKRKGTDYNMPTQKSMELGLFEIKETPQYLNNGSVRIVKTPKVTGKGQQYFVNLFLKKNKRG